MASKTFRQQISDWNNSYPFDLAWRLKNDVQFGSPEHKSMDFISMLFNLIQDKELQKHIEKAQNKAEGLTPEEEKEYFGESDVVQMSKEEIDKEFDNLDIDKLNEQLNNGSNTTGDNIQG